MDSAKGESRIFDINNHLELKRAKRRGGARGQSGGDVTVVDREETELELMEHRSKRARMEEKGTLAQDDEDQDDEDDDAFAH